MRTEQAQARGVQIAADLSRGHPRWARLVRKSATRAIVSMAWCRSSGRVGGGDGVRADPEQIQVGLSHARRSADVIMDADTRALRHIQRRRAFELVSA